MRGIKEEGKEIEALDALSVLTESIVSKTVTQKSQNGSFA